MIMRTICTFVCLVMLIITGISFIFIINPKRTKQIQSSFDLEQPIQGYQRTEYTGEFESSKKHDSALFKF